MTGRKTIFKCRVGSHLYGTNRPDSDEDFAGVFLPSSYDLLGMRNCPGEMTDNVKVSEGERNTKGDVDCKYFSLPKFLKLAAQGQPGQLEMIFAPDSCVLERTEEWEAILDCSHFFLSTNGVGPILGFATAQARKAKLKGEHLNTLRNLVGMEDWLQQNHLLNSRLRDFAPACPSKTSGLYDKIFLGSMQFERFENDHGAWLVRVAGRTYDEGTKVKTLLSSAKELIGKYGTRAQNAAENGYDYKSLGHAVRLVHEAKEFLLDGRITLPRPSAERKLLHQIFAGENENIDIEWLYQQIDRIENEIIPESPNPKKANWSQLEKLCVSIMREHLLNASGNIWHP